LEIFEMVDFIRKLKAISMKPAIGLNCKDL
jgi:hypothetical protein